MSIKGKTQEELELMSDTDITYELLKENKKSMKTADLFKNICKLLGYSDTEFEEKIGDYYTSLNLDKRFVLLDGGIWDIRDRHVVNLVVDDEDDDLVVEEIEEEEEIEEVEEDDDTDEDLEDDDLEDLAIIGDDDEEDTDI